MRCCAWTGRKVLRELRYSGHRPICFRLRSSADFITSRLAAAVLASAAPAGDELRRDPAAWNSGLARVKRRKRWPYYWPVA